MFGKNEIRPVSTDPHSLQVADVFSTIQGEGPWSGFPAVFVRLSGCNLKCFFCDTKWDDNSDPNLTPDEIVSRVMTEYNKYASGDVTKRVILTGGEPARQNCSKLIDKLNETGFRIQIETAGTYWHDWLFKTTIVISPKTKHVHKMFYFLPPSMLDWKYVIRAGEVDEVDGLPKLPTQQLDPSDPENSTSALTIIKEKYGAPARPLHGSQVWLSPCNEYDETKNAANRTEVARNCMKFGYRAQVQLHVYLNLP